MSRCVLVRGDVVTFLDLSPTDAMAMPQTASLISEADWANLVGSSDEKSFAELEADLIKSLGWVYAENPGI